VSIREILATSPHFSDLSAEELDLLDRVLFERRWPAGHVFLREGDRAVSINSAMYVILEGEVVVTVGRGTEVGRLGPGDLFGHMSLLDHGPRGAECAGVTRTRTAELTRATFDELQRSHTALAAWWKLLVAGQLARDLRMLTGLVAEAAAGDSTPLRRRLGLAS
jgi:CRP-like cAMP-binding protein